LPGRYMRTDSHLENSLYSTTICQVPNAFTTGELQVCYQPGQAK
jgi:hypothetical protein